MPAESLHAGCVLVGEAGILIRGEAGSGKSTLALALVEAAATRGLLGRLVADDRVRVEACHGRAVARPHPAIAGLVEVRGLGIVRADSAPAVVLRLVVDLVEDSARLPEPASATVAGVALPLLRLPVRSGAAAAAIMRRLGTGRAGGPCDTAVS